MFCQQCQETAKGIACNVGGVCGKNAEVAAYQDAVLYALSGYAYRSLHGNVPSPGLEPCVVDALFATLTNVDFDPGNFAKYLNCIISHRDELPKVSGEPASVSWTPKSAGEIVNSNVTGLDKIEDTNTRSLFEIVLFGCKGLAAYYSHALVLGKKDDSILEFIRKALASRFENRTVDERTALVLECGSFGAKVLALLDSANQSYGVPEITQVTRTPGKKPGILVTGHDLKDLEMLLEQTKGTGVDVYTHGEMLPAHSYPAFKKYDNLVGHYGTSWANQKAEMPGFNGPVLFTTNCLVPPAPEFKDKVFTTGVVGFPGCEHIAGDASGYKDFSKLIAAAKVSAPPTDLGHVPLTIGCGHNAVLALAPKVIELVKSGKIKRFVVMAGCDGRQKNRSYYTEFAEALPKDTIILTAGCAKYRYNDLDLGDIEGIPRVLDAGQCNDSYSLVVIALALADAFGVGVNELPVSYNIAWYEQKALLVLLTLLHFDVKNIMIGPTLPAFVSPDVLKVLVDTFGLQPNTDVETDLKTLHCV